MERLAFTGITTPNFIADPGTEQRSNGGRQVDWAQVPAEFSDPASGLAAIPAGTVMSELANGKVVPRSAGIIEAPATTATTARFIAESTMQEGVNTHAISGYGMLVGGVLYENLLPDSAGAPAVLPAAFHAELDVQGRTTFIYTQYSDSRGA